MPRGPGSDVRSVDPASEPVGVLITSSNGVVYRGMLEAGDMETRKVGFLFRDPLAAIGAGTRGGLSRVRRKNHPGEGYKTRFAAYGDIGARAMPRMTVQFRIGDDVCIGRTSWSEETWGWTMNTRPRRD